METPEFFVKKLECGPGEPQELSWAIFQNKDPRPVARLATKIWADNMAWHLNDDFEKKKMGG